MKIFICLIIFLSSTFAGYIGGPGDYQNDHGTSHASDASDVQTIHIIKQESGDNHRNYAPKPAHGPITVRLIQEQGNYGDYSAPAPAHPPITVRLINEDKDAAQVPAREPLTVRFIQEEGGHGYKAAAFIQPPAPITVKLIQQHAPTPVHSAQTIRLVKQHSAPAPVSPPLTLHLIKESRSSGYAGNGFSDNLDAGKIIKIIAAAAHRNDQNGSNGGNGDYGANSGYGGNGGYGSNGAGWQ